MSNFLLESRGYCLYCLKRDESQIVEQIPSFSFQRLLKYLKFDVKCLIEVGGETGLEELWRECEIKGTLCAKCENLLEKTLDVLEQLEVLQLKLDSYLKLMREELEQANQDLGEFQEGFKGQLEVVERFRKQLESKCSVYLNKRRPHLILEKIDNSNYENHAMPTTPPLIKEEIEYDAIPEIDENATIEETIEYKHVINEPIPELVRTKKSRKKLFDCDLCDKSYSFARELKEHQQGVHEGLQYKCSACDFTSVFSSSMAKHRRKAHKGLTFPKKYEMTKVEPAEDVAEKTFKCTICKEKFISKSGLKIHKKTVHLVIRFTCQYCGMVFTQKGHMKAHIEVSCKKRPQT